MSVIMNMTISMIFYSQTKDEEERNSEVNLCRDDSHTFLSVAPKEIVLYNTLIKRRE